MKKLKPTLFLLTLVLLFTAFAGCNDKSNSPKTFSKLEMSITLTEEFVEKNHISHTVYYEASDKIVTALREDFNYFPSGYTVSDYAEAVIDTNYLNSKVYNNRVYNYAYFTYEKEVNEQEFFYFATCHASDTAFWLIQFACLKEDKADLLDTFKTYANSVEFENQSPTPVSSRSSRSQRTSTPISVNSSSTNNSVSASTPSTSSEHSFLGTYKFYGMIVEGALSLVTDQESIDAGFTPDLYVFDIKENNQLSVSIMTFQYTGTWQQVGDIIYLYLDGETLETTIDGDLLYWVDDVGDTLILLRVGGQSNPSISVPTTSLSSSGYQDF